MPTFIYMPVATAEMRAVAKVWNDGRAAQHKAPYQIIANDTSGNMKAIRRAVGRGFLAQVAPNDKIYVLSHGISTKTSGGALVIGNQRGGTLTEQFVGGLQVIGGVHKTYTDATFARHLEEEGLTKAFVDLRLFCCCTGLDGSYKGAVLAPYAKRLKQSLAHRGYNHVQVTGYLGDVSAYGDYFPRGTMYLHPDTRIGKGPTVRLDGEYAPMKLNDHAVTF